MNNTIYTNKESFDKTLNNIKKDWYKNLHILADFDKTLTKAFSNWKKRPSLISVLRSEWYLSEKYQKEAYKLFDYYNPIEINPDISMEIKSKEMTIWWNKHLDLLVKSWLTKNDIDSVSNSWIIELRNWVKEFLSFLNNNDIPLLIISANWLWTDSIKLYLQKEWVLTNNIHVISNSFEWDNNWKAIWYDKRVIHTFNKWETVLEEFPEIYSKIKTRTNVILLWDSLWDHHMVDWFDYKNLLKIWFLNDNEDELLESYKQRYDLILTWDSEGEILNELF